MEKMEKIYEEYCENRAAASDDVREIYQKMNDVFMDYLNAVCEDEFRNAFMFGYAYGLKAAKAEMKKGQTA